MNYNKIEKDKKFRITYKKAEKKKRIFRYLLENTHIKESTKTTLNFLFYKIHRYSAISYIRNRCVLTGRSRGILARYRISRHMFKKFVKFGKLSGVKKI
jgi:small subunit ribosomal protein S14